MQPIDPLPGLRPRDTTASNPWRLAADCGLILGIEAARAVGDRVGIPSDGPVLPIHDIRSASRGTTCDEPGDGITDARTRYPDVTSWIMILGIDPLAIHPVELRYRRAAIGRTALDEAPLRRVNAVFAGIVDGLDRQDLTAIIEICHALAGMPAVTGQSIVYVPSRNSK